MKSSSAAEPAAVFGNELPWAPWLDLAFTRALHSKGHALLLEAPSGMGQWPISLALAKAWLCDAPMAERPSGQACGHCASCDLVAAHTHPDLCVLMPEAVAIDVGWPLSAQAQADIDDKKRKPSKEIRADDAAALVSFAQRTSARQQGKVALVYPAERMNATSANGLLKVLEEPPGKLRFVLAVEGSAHLLPTIRSRCQALPLSWPGEAESVAWLHALGDASETSPGSPGSGAIWLTAAGGRAHEAARLSRLGDSQQWQQLPARLAQGDGACLSELHGADASAWVDTLQKLCHDRLAVSYQAPPRFFSPADLGEAARWQSGPLLAWSDELRQHARQAQHPLKPELLLQLLAAQAQAAHVHAAGFLRRTP